MTIPVVPSQFRVPAKGLVLAVACLASALHAQAPQPQEPTPEQLKAIVEALRTQRDRATQSMQDLQVQLSLVSAELEALKKQAAKPVEAAPKQGK